MSPSNVVTQDPEILGGITVFTGTPVPVNTLFAYFEGGESIDEFLDYFPSVERASSSDNRLDEADIAGPGYYMT